MEWEKYNAKYIPKVTDIMILMFFEAWIVFEYSNIQILQQPSNDTNPMLKDPLESWIVKLQVQVQVRSRLGPGQAPGQCSSLKQTQNWSFRGTWRDTIIKWSTATATATATTNLF